MSARRPFTVLHELPKASLAAAFLFAAASPCPAAAKGTAVLVEKGVPRAVVVLAKKPTRSAQLAACELRAHVRMMSGAELPTIDDGAAVPTGLLPVYVGESAAMREQGIAAGAFAVQEHLVRITPRFIALLGRDYPDYGPVSYEKTGGWPGMDVNARSFEVGTLYAVYDFLEKDLGVRWYMPTDLGTVCQKRSTVAVGTGERLLRPWTTYRRIGAGNWGRPGTFGELDSMGYERNANYISARDNTLYLLRTRQTGVSYAIAGHSILPEYHRRFGADHRDWFVDDTPGPNIQLKFHHPGVIAQVTKDAVEQLEKSQTGLVIIGPPDNRIFGTECVPPLQPERKRPGTFSDGIASNYWFTLVNHVARGVAARFPEGWVSVPAYASHYEPPEFDLEPNVGVSVCNTEGWDADSYGMENLRAWRRRVRRLFCYEYHYSGGRFPAVQPRKTAAYISRLRDIGVEGMFMERISNADATTYHLDHYVATRMLFDRTAEGAAIMAEYFRLFYGPAEKPMKEFWTEVEQTRDREAAALAKARSNNEHWVIACSPARMVFLDGCLARAERLARAEPYAERVKSVRTGLYEQLAVRREHAERILRHPVPVLDVRRSAVRPVVDGALDEACWSAAARTAPLVHLKGEKAATEDIGMAIWTGETLYLALRLREPKMDAQTLDRKTPSPGICMDDSVEVVLDVGKRMKKDDYLHLMLNALGVFWHQWTRYGWCRPVPVDLGLKAAARRSADEWTAEFEIPLGVLTGGALPKAGDEWGLNLFRNRHAAGAEYAIKERFTTGATGWSATFGMYHVLDRFGILRFKQ